MAAVLLSACGGVFRTGAASVDGRTIDEDAFVEELNFLLADPAIAQQLPGEEGELQRQQFARDFLTFLIHQQIVEVFADDRQISVTPEEVDERMEGLVQQLGGQDALDEQVRSSGVSLAQIKDLVRQQILREKVADVVVEEGLTEERLRQLYEERVDDLTQVHVAHILVSTEAEAQRILDQATPNNFADLARKFSQDTGSAASGGDLGFRRPSELVGPFAQAMLEIPEGEVGGPVQTEFGFHLIHVIERQTQPFEEVRAQLLQEARGETFRDWLLGRIAEAEILVNPRYGVFDEQNGVVIARTSTTPSPQQPVQVAP
jgi:foldase protein PrsA